MVFMAHFILRYLSVIFLNIYQFSLYKNYSYTFPAYSTVFLHTYIHFTLYHFLTNRQKQLTYRTLEISPEVEFFPTSLLKSSTSTLMIYSVSPPWYLDMTQPPVSLYNSNVITKIRCAARSFL